MEHVFTPAVGVSDVRGRARIPAEVEVLRQAQAERRGHLRERPVGDADGLEAAGQGLAQPRLHEQGRRSQYHHVQGAPSGPVGVPEPFDGVRPSPDLLDLVEHQHEAPARLVGPAPRLFPVPRQPFDVSHLGQQRSGLGRFGAVGGKQPGLLGLVDREVEAVLSGLPERLAHDGGLSGLPGPEHRDYPARRLGQPTDKGGHMRSLEHPHRIIVYS